MTDNTQEFDAFNNPEWEAFSKGAKNLYWHIRRLVAKISREGWRPSFIWTMGAAVVAAFWVSFVLLPSQHHTLPEYFYVQLNLAFGLMLGAMGLRAWEKKTADELAAEQTRRIEQP